MILKYAHINCILLLLLFGAYAYNSDLRDEIFFKKYSQQTIISLILRYVYKMLLFCLCYI